MARRRSEAQGNVPERVQHEPPCSACPVVLAYKNATTPNARTSASECSSMYRIVFKTLVFPALDRLNGTRIASVLKYLEETEHYSRRELLELQRQKLAKILSWTEAKARFYQEIWKQPGDRVRAASEYPELNGLPIIDKEDFRPRLAEFPLPAFS
ncbi:MAG: hypothetical protein D6815_03335, partial [Candidatus Dadabacteria bacterium]